MKNIKIKRRSFLYIIILQPPSGGPDLRTSQKNRKDPFSFIIFTQPNIIHPAKWHLACCHKLTIRSYQKITNYILHLQICFSRAFSAHHHIISTDHLTSKFTPYHSTPPRTTHTMHHPNFQFTPDQSWPKPNQIAPSYAIKRALWGCWNGVRQLLNQENK